jgi:hypothetical protein
MPAAKPTIATNEAALTLPGKVIQHSRKIATLCGRTMRAPPSFSVHH